MRFKLSLFLALTVVAALTLFSTSALTQTQTQQKKRPKLKDFGSSLKRLKWDPVKKTTVELKSQGNRTGNSDEDDVVRIETNLVTCDVLVVDRKGNLVGNLTADDFSISEDGQQQQVGHFRLGDNASISRSIVLIIDYSSSQFPYLRRSVDAAKLMVDKLSPLDVMAIVTDDVELLVDFTSDKKKLKEKLESLVERTEDKKSLFGIERRKFGRSTQYSSLVATLNEAFIEEDLRPIIVFQTDGDEVYSLRDAVLIASPPPDLPDDLKAEVLNSLQRRLQFTDEHRQEFSLADVYRMVEKSRATIYTVIPGLQLLNKSDDEKIALMKKDVERAMSEILDRLNPKQREQLKLTYERWRTLSPVNLLARARNATAMQTALAAVAPRSGGWTEFLETPEQAEGIYDRILADINHRYIVGYYPTNKAHDGARRKIKFEVKGHPEYYVIGRSSYYAPTQ